MIDTSGGLSHPGGAGASWLDHNVQIGTNLAFYTAQQLFNDGTLSFKLDSAGKAGLFWNTDAGQGDNQSIELARMTSINHMSASDVKII